MVLPADANNGASGQIIENIDKAIKEQLRISQLLIFKPLIATNDIRKIAGVDAAYTNKEVIAAAVNLSYPEETIISESVIRERALFPYLPGLFMFREGQAIIKALIHLSCKPDMIMIHGHGLAHPRRCGIASHIGVILNRPTMGIADHILIGEISTLPSARGSMVPIVDRGEIIGMAVRTKEGARPVYTSVGNRTNLDQVVALTLATTGKHRLPAPLRMAHQRAHKERARDWKK